MNLTSTDKWFDGDDDQDIDVSFKDYQITAAPNDFNIKTIVDFVQSGVMQIPGFQRSYVWDIQRASRLIESLLIGLPIPQIFLYEQARNKYQVIDGQQRMMSIYYFVNKRFPKLNKRLALRRIFATEGIIPASIFANDEYFVNFNLELPGSTRKTKSRFDGLNYDTLGEYKTTLDLTVIRNVIIKQNSPTEDRDSSIFEIFNRLNTGGVNLSPQEIRASIYQSKFLTALDSLTFDPNWRKIVGKNEPDIHLRESEILLRAVAMLVLGNEYREPMTLFLNDFAKQAMRFSEERIGVLSAMLRIFFQVYSTYGREFFSATNRVRFNIALFEAVFRVACENALSAGHQEIIQIPEFVIDRLKDDNAFKDSIRLSTSSSAKVKQRYNTLLEYLHAV